MKKLLIVMLAVVMVCGAAFAQEFQPAAKSGAKSLNFTFDGLGAFGIGATGPNGGLGLSYFMSNDAAIRLGFQIALPSMTSPANPAAGKTGTDATASAFSFGVGADYLMYMYGMTPRVKPFAGLGVRFGMVSTNDKDGSNDNSVGPFVQTETKNRAYDKNGNAAGVTINNVTYNAGTQIGLMGIVGAEFFIYPELSLSAEYDLNLFSSTSASDQVSTTGPTSVTIKSPSFTKILGFSAVGAALHIYF
jgi:opacity protein-like surface antigen